MTVEQFITFIVDLAEEELYEKLDGETQFYFMNGGCYEFAKVLKQYIPKSQIVINNSNNHCGIIYKGKTYDATGEIENNNEFRIANSEDINYMEDGFGIVEKEYINGKRISDLLIEEIKKCNILDKLEWQNEDMER